MNVFVCTQLNRISQIISSGHLIVGGIYWRASIHFVIKVRVKKAGKGGQMCGLQTTKLSLKKNLQWSVAIQKI